MNVMWDSKIFGVPRFLLEGANGRFRDRLRTSSQVDETSCEAPQINLFAAQDSDAEFATCEIKTEVNMTDATLCATLPTATREVDSASQSQLVAQYKGEEIISSQAVAACFAELRERLSKTCVGSTSLVSKKALRVSGVRDLFGQNPFSGHQESDSVGLLCFLDPTPQKNWSHRCGFGFVGADGQCQTTIHGWPPSPDIELVLSRHQSN